MATHAFHRVAPICVGFSIGGLSYPALAEADPDKEKRERIEVTGSHIKRVDYEGTAPVQVITRKQIERSGATDLAALLRTVPAMGGGSTQDFNVGTGFQRGNQTVSLRGLGPVATLVLLNGRRLPAAPYADPNTAQGNSFNLNIIPLSAIERIDILKDGASAIYGSDAIAGVVNVILRKDYRGAEASWSHWQRLEEFGDMNYRAEQLSGSIGFGDLARDRYNAMFVVDYYRREPQGLYESGSGVRNDDYRRLTGRLNPVFPNSPPAFANSFPGNMRREATAGSGVFNTRLPIDLRCPQDLRVQVTPTIQECRWDQYANQYIVSEQDRGGLLGRLAFTVDARTQAFLEASFTRTRAEFQGNPPSLGGNLALWFSRDGQPLTYQLTLPPGHPDNPYPFRVGVFYRFADLGNTRALTETDFSRVVTGANGAFGAWDWESAILWSDNRREDKTNNLLHQPSLSAAVATGAYRFNGNAPNSRALLATLNPDYFQTGTSKVLSWDFKGSRELWQMRGGPAAIGTGVELRREDMEVVSDPRCDAAEFIGATCSSSIRGKRDIWSAFGELSLPVVKAVELQAAARYDHYSDFGGAWTPKIGFKWTAADSLALRGTYGRGFRAPSLFQIATSNVTGFSAVTDPIRCPNGAPVPGAEPADCNGRNVATFVRANPDLEPETSTSHTFGFVFSPSQNVAISAELWYVKHDNFIDRPEPQFVVNNESAPAVAGGIVLRDQRPETWIPGIANSGPILGVMRGFRNLGGTAAQGIDFDATLRWSLSAFGRAGLEVGGTYYDKLLWKFSKNGPYLSGLGNFLMFESPRFRMQATATWDYGTWSFLGRYNYTAGWNHGEPTTVVNGDRVPGPLGCYLNPSNAVAAATLAFLGGCAVSSWETFDVGASWTGVRNLKVGMLVRNVMDRAAPYDPSQPTLGFNPTFHNPYGRYLQFSVSYRFR